MASKLVSSLQSMQNSDAISYLSQKEAAEIDEILMGPLGFSVDQLMVSVFGISSYFSSFLIQFSSGVVN